MFTGIVQYLIELKISDKDVYLYGPTDFNKLLKIGDSVCVNGVCLTVVELSDRFCRFETTKETRSLVVFTSPANVELSLKFDDRLGGHIVYGHVHGKGLVQSFEDEDLWIDIFNAEAVASQLKGSICINGVSLTIAEIKGSLLRVSLIPETIKRTNLQFVQFGDFVNVEFNIPQTPHIPQTPQTEFTTLDMLYTNSNSLHTCGSDAFFMNIAINEGEKGKLTAPPNPWVGCVIVKNNKIVAKGYHALAGSDHAEVIALKNAGAECEKSTLYCTLEPCCHHGRTPPCTDLIISKGVQRVVIGILDPDERVSGNGVKKLKAAGIEVLVLQDSAQKKQIEFNLRYYIHQRKTGLPYVTAKIALTADGCYRDDDIKWITHKGSRKELYSIWATCDAILIGAGTVEADDPQLEIRKFKGDAHNDTHDEVHDEACDYECNCDSTRDKVREAHNEVCDDTIKAKKIIIDGEHLMTDRKLMRNGAWIATTNPNKWGEYKNIIHYKNGELCNIFSHEFFKDSLHCLIEGGAALHRTLFDVVQEIVILRGSKIFGNGYHWNIPHTKVRLIETKQIEWHGELNVLERYIVIKDDSLQCNRTNNNNHNNHNNNNHNNNSISSKQQSNENVFTPMSQAIKHFVDGGTVLILDNESRENEGDLVTLASKITEYQMTELINHTSGIICVPMETAHASRLKLERLINNDKFSTPFTISVDHVNTKTGISSKDRLLTVKSLADDASLPTDFSRPGHIFPLIAHPDGLRARQGHTEASVALCKISNVYPRVAVIGELKNVDGTIKNREQCFVYAKNNNIPIISIDQLVEIEKQTPKICLLAECNLKSAVGDSEWKIMCFDSGDPSFPHKVFMYPFDMTNDIGNVDGNAVVPVRIHSECFTGDVFKSQHCDCGNQLNSSMEYIVNKGKGIIVFPAKHEGRGIGFVNKVKAYKIQKEHKVDTYKANNMLGFADDARTYEDINKILEYLDVESVELLTDNPLKCKAIKNVSSTTPITTHPGEFNCKYLMEKVNHFAPFPKITIEPFETPKKVAIVYAMWHSIFVDQIRHILKEHLENYNVTITEYDAPGTNEVPFVASKIAPEFDGIICVGILLKGDTLHFENVSSAASNGIMQAQINTGVPMMNCILPCLNVDQIVDRIKGPKSTLEYIVLGLIKMMKL